jgi:hypothetical protein
MERPGLVVHANALDEHPTVCLVNRTRLTERTTLSADSTLTTIAAPACGGQCPQTD